MVSVKNRKIAAARFHAAVRVGQQYLNTAAPGLNTVTQVDLVEMGVLVTSIGLKNKKFEVVVPFADITEIELVVEDEPTK